MPECHSLILLFLNSTAAIIQCLVKVNCLCLLLHAAKLFYLMYHKFHVIICHMCGIILLCEIYESILPIDEIIWRQINKYGVLYLFVSR